MTSKDIVIRRETLKILGALGRIGSEEAIQAIVNIRKAFEK